MIHPSARFQVAVMVMICLTAGHATAQQNGEGRASKAWQLIKTLEGTWKATTAKGARAVLYYDLVSNGTALHERFIDEGNKSHSNLVTVYFLNKEHLEAVHFCSMNNQPFLRGGFDPVQPEHITLSAYQVSNLKTPGAAHMYKVTYKFSGSDRMTTIWTMTREGKDVFVETLDWERESKGTK